MESDQDVPVPWTSEQVSTVPDNAKLNVCDRCNQQKMKCDRMMPCQRCHALGYRCSRDVVRRRRGPGKGSGSVMAKALNEDEQMLHHGIRDPSVESQTFESSGGFSLSLSRSIPAGSMHSSPALGPSEVAGPTSHPANMESAAISLQMGPSLTSASSPWGQQQVIPAAVVPVIGFPVSWQGGDTTLPYQRGTAAPLKDLVKLDELAHRTSDNKDYFSGPSYHAAPVEVQGVPQPFSIQPILNVALPSQPVYMTPSDVGEAASICQAGPPHLYDTTLVASTFDYIQITAMAAEFGISSTTVSQCVQQYFRHLYSIMPVIHEATFRHKLNNAEKSLSIDDKCLILSMCALTVLYLPSRSEGCLKSQEDQSRLFLSQLRHLRCATEWIETASLAAIIASYFASVSYVELKQPHSSNHSIREATGMALELGLHLDSFYDGMDSIATICHRRAFALLFVAGRCTSLLRNKPMLIPVLHNIPQESFSDEDPSIVKGFQRLCKLLALLDDNFIEVWHSWDSLATKPSIESLPAIQQKLSSISFEPANLSDIQRAQVHINQQWLRLVVWQASVRQGIVTHRSENPAFAYSYPLLVADSLCRGMSTLPVSAVTVHGLGIFRKIFEVAFALVDALNAALTPWVESNELKHLFKWLSATPNSRSTYLKLLKLKLGGADV